MRIRNHTGALLFGPIGVCLLCACLSSNPSPPAAPTVPTSQIATPPPTVSSQPQPGANGTVMSGTITLVGGPPPPSSTLFLGLVKSTSDTQPRTCIDAERDPVDATGKFSARVACTPQPGDQLTYTLVVGAAGDRNWHTGYVAIPADLTTLKIDAPQ